MGGSCSRSPWLAPELGLPPKSIRLPKKHINDMTLTRILQKERRQLSHLAEQAREDDEECDENSKMTENATTNGDITNSEHNYSKSESASKTSVCDMNKKEDVNSANGPVSSSAASSAAAAETPGWITYDYNLENLTFSGGGLRGFAYTGALQALYDCGIFPRIRRVAGSSVGAICAALVAVGCTPQEVADVFALDVKWLFHDQQCSPLVCVPNIVRRLGIHPARRFYDIYGGHIKNKLGSPDITFKQLFDLTGRELCIVVTNLTHMRAEYCNHRTTPDIPIRLAVRMSMAFPVVYQPVLHRLLGDADTQEQCLYMDGGTLDQYPVHVFDTPGGGVDINDNQTHRNDKTLGLYVVSECAIDYKIWKTIFRKEIPYKPSYVPDTKLAHGRLKDHHPKKKNISKGPKSSKFKKSLRSFTASLESIFKWPEEDDKKVIKTFKDYFIATIETLLIHQRRLLVKEEDADRTVPINCGYIGTNDYQIDMSDREFMIRQGYECTRQYLIDFIKRKEDEITQPKPSNDDNSTIGNGIPSNCDQNSHQNGLDSANKHPQSRHSLHQPDAHHHSIHDIPEVHHSQHPDHSIIRTIPERHYQVPTAVIKQHHDAITTETHVTTTTSHHQNGGANLRPQHHHNPAMTSGPHNQNELRKSAISGAYANMNGFARPVKIQSKSIRPTSIETEV